MRYCWPFKTNTVHTQSRCAPAAGERQSRAWGKIHLHILMMHSNHFKITRDFSSEFAAGSAAHWKKTKHWDFWLFWHIYLFSVFVLNLTFSHFLSFTLLTLRLNTHTHTPSFPLWRVFVIFRNCLAHQWLHPWTPASWDRPAQPTADPHHGGPCTPPHPPPNGARAQKGGSLSHHQGNRRPSWRVRSQHETSCLPSSTSA